MFALLLEIEDITIREYFLALYLANRSSFFGCALGILNDAALAEDALQTAFVRLIQNYAKLISIDEDMRVAYALETIRNVCYDTLKRPSAKHELLTDDIARYVDAQTRIIITDGSEGDKLLVHKAMDSIKPRYKDILQMRFFLDWDYKTIAAQMGISVDNVGSLLNRARRALKKELLKEMRHEGD